MLELMKSTLKQIIASYTQYFGVGSYMLLYISSLIYIYATEKKKIIRDLLFYYPLLVLAVIFNPLIAYVIMKFIENQVYWRMFWILLLTIIIAYAATMIVQRISRNYGKVVVTLFIIIIMILGGKFIFTPANYSTSFNWYKLPVQTIEVCNIIENDSNTKIRVVVPADLEVSVRQYDANIQMPYGRDGYDNTGALSETGRAFHSLMQDSVLNVELISSYMRGFECNYIVIKKTTVLSENLEISGYKFVASTDSYNIYRFDYKKT
ncbi:MAG: hypothetical protein WCG21_02805 [Eubacteriales bacterium]